MKTLELQLKKNVLIFQPDERGNINSWIALHSKKWNFICLGLELTEEIASELVNIKYDNYDIEWYKDYRIINDGTEDDYVFLIAKESFISAVESKGFYWLKNPIDEPNKYVQKCMSFENLSNQFKLFDEKEEKTFKNPLIFVKK